MFTRMKRWLRRNRSASVSIVEDEGENTDKPGKPGNYRVETTFSGQWWFWRGWAESYEDSFRKANAVIDPKIKRWLETGIR